MLPLDPSQCRCPIGGTWLRRPSSGDRNRQLCWALWWGKSSCTGFVLGKQKPHTELGQIPLTWPSLDLPRASRQSFCSRNSIMQQYHLESGYSWISFPLFSSITAKSSHFRLLSRIWHSPFSMGWSWSSSFLFPLHFNTCSWSTWEPCPEQLTYSSVCCSGENRSILTFISQCLNPPPTVEATSTTKCN